MPTALLPSPVQLSWHSLASRETIGPSSTEADDFWRETGPRYVARSSGIKWSFVNGRPIIQDGRLPAPEAVAGAGRVIRAA